MERTIRGHVGEAAEAVHLVVAGEEPAVGYPGECEEGGLHRDAEDRCFL